MPEEDAQPNLLAQAAGVVSDEELATKAAKNDRDAFNELIDRNVELINAKISRYRKAAVPASVLFGHSIKILKGCIDRFDASAGVKFSTFYEANLRGLSRYVNQNKSAARIPEHRHRQIERYKTTKSILSTQKGREATPNEMANALAWSVTEVAKMEESLSRANLSAASMEFDQEADTTSSRIADTVEFVYYSLTPQEQLVYDYSLGTHGKQALHTVKDIADKTQLSTDQVYNAKKAIAKKIMNSR